MTRSQTSRTVLGLLIALVLAAPVAGCARKSDPQAGDNPAAGQLGEAPGAGDGAGGPGTEPDPATDPSDPSPDPTPEVSPEVPPEEEPPGPDPGPIGPIVVTFDPGLLLPWPSPADCTSHNPATLSIKYTASGPLWQVVDGNHALLAYKREVDAKAGLALAKAYKKHCFIGRNNTRADRFLYIMDYWLDPVAPSPAITNPDCLSHNPGNLSVVDLGATGWGVRDGAKSIAVFDTKADADKGVLVLKHYNRHCYVGRGYTGADRIKYITNWYASA
jgi:hypothetical protein